MQNYNIVALAMSRHLRYEGRFALLTFFPMNRVPPVLVMELIQAAGMLHDQDAIDHILSMLKAFAHGTFKKYRAYAMETKEWISVEPPAARGGDWHGAGSDWTSAIELAKTMKLGLAGKRKRG